MNCSLPRLSYAFYFIAVMYNYSSIFSSNMYASTNGSSYLKSSYNKDILTLSVTVILAVLIVLTILGNSLVCLAFYRQPHIRRVSYYPIFSLAIADLLCGTLAMPAYIAKKHVKGGWQETMTCDVFRFTYFFTEYASVLSLTAISIERFIAIKIPVRHRTFLTTKKMTVVLVVSWLDAAVVSVLPFFWHENHAKESCTYGPTREWSMMVILANVFFPFLIMLGCHLYTVSHAIHHSRLRHDTNRLANGRRWPNITRRKSSEDTIDAVSLKRNREISCTMGIVVGAFVFCWGPSTFYYFIRMVCPQCYSPDFEEIKQIFNAVVKLLTFSNSCLNPLIYCWLNLTLRNAFYQSLLRKSEARRRRFNQLSSTYRNSLLHKTQGCQHVAFEIQ